MSKALKISETRASGGLLITDNTIDTVFEIIYEAIGEHRKPLSEMLEEDRLALSADEMRYFPPAMFGRLPTYGTFVQPF